MLCAAAYAAGRALHSPGCAHACAVHVAAPCTPSQLPTRCHRCSALCLACLPSTLPTLLTCPAQPALLARRVSLPVPHCFPSAPHLPPPPLSQPGPHAAPPQPHAGRRRQRRRHSAQPRRRPRGRGAAAAGARRRRASHRQADEQLSGNWRGCQGKLGASRAALLHAHPGPRNAGAPHAGCSCGALARAAGPPFTPGVLKHAHSRQCM